MSNSIEAEANFRNAQKQTLTREQVAAHNTEQSSWVIVNGTVYDITDFASYHVSIRQQLFTRMFSNSSSITAWRRTNTSPICWKRRYRRILFTTQTRSVD